MAEGFSLRIELNMKNRFFTLFGFLLLGFPLMARDKASSGAPSILNPDFGSKMVLTDMDGNIHNIEELTKHGLPIVLVFWQTWCVPCKREAPALAKVAAELSEKVKFFGIVSGNDEDVNDRKVKKFAEQFKLPYPQIRDRDLTLTKYFQIEGTPTIIILGTEKQILFRGHGLPNDLSKYTKI